MPWQVKPIRPARMKIDPVMREVLNTCDAEGRFQMRELFKTTQTWKHKVGFGYLVDTSGGNASVRTSAKSGNVQIWNMLDAGTRPHLIVARKAKQLRFRTGYRAKTRPRWFGSGSGGASGPWRGPHAVKHPGTAARFWTRTLSQQRQIRFRRDIQAAVKRGARQLYR